MPQNNKSHDNNYGGPRRHHPEHDERLLKNFTNDNEDFMPHSAQYNDHEEVRFNTEDRSEFRENSDNKDYAMNKDSERGAQEKYDNTDRQARRPWWSYFRK